MPKTTFFPTVTLTQDQIDFFNLQGYIALPPITNDAELARMRDAYDRIFTERAGRAEGNQFDLGGTDEDGKKALLPQILNPGIYAPELIEGQHRVNALSVVKQLLGEGAELVFDHAIFKPAGVGAATPWHQDEAYWDPQFAYRSVSVWMPLQPATIENGCMWFVPGSHLGEVLPHQSIGGDNRVHGLELVDGNITNGIACPLAPGGITVHLNRTMHYAGPNTSNMPRRAFISVFKLPDQPYVGERSFPWNDNKNTLREKRAQSVAKAT